MKKILQLIFDGATSAVALFVFPAIMVWVTWGMAGNWISYFWILILVAVLIGEVLNKLFSPDKKTLSSNVRKEVMKKERLWRIWTMLICWLAFSIQLFLHFIKPLVLQ